MTTPDKIENTTKKDVMMLSALAILLFAISQII
jgi:hypothetical protein